MKSEYINGQVVRRRRQRLGAEGSIRAFARSVRLTSTSIRSIELVNEIPGETPLHLLTRMAGVLGVPVTDLIGRPEPESDVPATEPDDMDHLAEDVARLGRLLTHDERLTNRTAIALVFGWHLDRLRAAQEALSERLRPVGMTVHYSNAGIGLRPIDSSADSDADQVASMRLATDGMTLTQGELLLDVMTGRLLSNQVTEGKLPHLSNLMNLGLVYQEMRGGMNSYRLTADAVYAFDV